MQTYTGPREPVSIIGTKTAVELSPGDRVHFPGTGLIKQVHSVDRHRDGLVVRESGDEDGGLMYPRDGVLIRWSAPHNKVNLYTTPSSVMEMVA